MTGSTASKLDVTVVIPVYNRSGLIIRALESVRQQSRWPAHTIVVDDASTDDTVTVVETWGDTHSFPVTVESLPTNQGPAAARNRGIELATTRYVSFLDSDDEQRPNTLKCLSRALDSHPDAVLSFADACVVTPTLQVPNGLFQAHVSVDKACEVIQGTDPLMYRLRDATGILLNASVIPTSATCFRRDAALAAGLMPTNFFSNEDWLFWLRLSKQGSFILQLEDLAAHYRHDENLTHTRNAEFTTREKLRGYLALVQGSIDIVLTTEQQAIVVSLMQKQLGDWRYQLSLLGLGHYLAGLRSEVAREFASPVMHCLTDIRSLIRAFVNSWSTSA